MSFALIGLIAALTFASRAIALVAMPEPSPRVKVVLDRIPAPLFASLAAISLFGGDGIADAPTFSAAAGALLATPTRSLLWVLVGGVGGFVIGTLVL